jgi:hypothetical protein
MFYNYGKNYFLSLDSVNLKDSNTDEILEFLRGYIELHSNIILPTNVSNYLKNINYVYDKYPLLILYFRKTEHTDNILIERLLRLFSNELQLIYDVESKIKVYNKIKYQFLIKLENYNVLNLLSKIYPPDIDKNDIDEYTYSLYINLSNYRYINYDNENETLQYYIPKCKIKLIHPAARTPFKECASNIGYTISIIKLHKIISNKIRIYDTGLQIIPQYGYYYKLEPKSILSTHGYILGTSIDSEQKKDKTLLITLIKIDDDLPDIQLPYNCCILLMKELKHYEIMI